MLAAICDLSGLILDEDAVFLWKCHFESAPMKLMSRIDELRHVLNSGLTRLCFLFVYFLFADC